MCSSFHAGYVPGLVLLALAAVDTIILWRKQAGPFTQDQASPSSRSGERGENGGEGGIRTRSTPLDSISYRFHFAGNARNASNAVAPCTPLHAVRVGHRRWKAPVVQHPLGREHYPPTGRDRVDPILGHSEVTGVTSAQPILAPAASRGALSRHAKSVKKKTGLPAPVDRRHEEYRPRVEAALRHIGSVGINPPYAGARSHCGSINGLIGSRCVQPVIINLHSKLPSSLQSSLHLCHSAKRAKHKSGQIAQ